MARKGRIEGAGAIYWVTAQCVAQMRLGEGDRGRLLQMIGRVVSRHRWICHAYAALESGYEMVIETPEGNLSKGMRDLNGEFTQAVNRERGRLGPIFRGRFKAAAVEKGEPLLEVCRAVALAPVREGLCKKPEKWTHGSYPLLAGMGAAPAFLTQDWVLAQFGGKPKKARARFEQFVKAGARGPLPSIRGGLFVGSEAFGAGLKRSKPDGAMKKAVRARPNLSHLFPQSVVMDKQMRGERMAQARIVYGYSLSEIARVLGVHPSTVSRAARKMEGNESTSERASERTKGKKKKKVMKNRH